LDTALKDLGFTWLSKIEPLASPEPWAVYPQLWRGGTGPDRRCLRWDHRITGAALIAKALTWLEQVLNTDIAA
jgi:hypothetical protein